MPRPCVGLLAVLSLGDQFEGAHTPVSQYLINLSSHEVNRASLTQENGQRKDAEDLFGGRALEANQDQDH